MGNSHSIQAYFKALQKGNYNTLIGLFDEGAIIVSPLYGEVKPPDFYRDLLKDTSSSTITPIRIFHATNRSVSAAHFIYEWTLANGTKTSFECIDIFEFSKTGLIQKLTIIYDTFKVRRSFKAQKYKTKK